jgi:hypothetical protein
MITHFYINNVNELITATDSTVDVFNSELNTKTDLLQKVSWET